MCRANAILLLRFSISQLQPQGASRLATAELTPSFTAIAFTVAVSVSVDLIPFYVSLFENLI